MFAGRPLKLLHVAALVAVLVLAQAVELGHLELDDSHPSGEVCALCVGLATLGAGNVSAPPHVPVQMQRPEGVKYEQRHRLDKRVERPFARSPPQAS
jgi:hypothetical protein